MTRWNWRGIALISGIVAASSLVVAKGDFLLALGLMALLVVLLGFGALIDCGVKALRRVQHLKTCPTCGGRGLVKDEPAGGH